MEMDALSPDVTAKRVQFVPAVAASVDETAAATSGCDADRASRSSGVSEGLALHDGPIVYCSAHPNDFASDPSHPSYPERIGCKLSLSAARERTYVDVACLTVKRLYPHLYFDPSLASRSLEAVSAAPVKCQSRRQTVFDIHVEAPMLGGQKLANTMGKYSALFSAETPVQVRFMDSYRQTDRQTDRQIDSCDVISVIYFFMLYD